MTTTDPTLADFARLLAKARERWPDAPGLPEGHRITNGRMSCRYDDGGDGQYVPPTAALALCITTAMEIGAWWQRQSIRRQVVFRALDGGWRVTVWDYEGPVQHESEHPTLTAAALAGLGAIVEGEP